MINWKIVIEFLIALFVKDFIQGFFSGIYKVYKNKKETK